MACKIVLVVVSLSVLAFFLCLGVAKADPQCMYKVNPYYHGRCENPYDENCRIACIRFEPPKYRGGEP
ncbi:hypothetical protein CFC21_091163 [Triticum aestivum]|uniref:Uncharacterized protein n=2 Tax=Triticum aestivum TaxID=4565 RepID=A0A9R1LFN7_WHEAT|nr:hypothetical protein CFC21_091162 [Triticum aestivum]KAF7088007.1 hypothetical protein CFC21_091163 [Triticum aestivum]